MQQRSYQTVRLERGKHASPQHGVCVMELASMLADEPFSDRPASVSTPLACFLRAYNDMVDDRHRQDLYEYAAHAVGTASWEPVERLRTRLMLEWAEGRSARKLRRSLLRHFWPQPLRWGRSNPEVVASYAIKAVGKVNDRTHTEVLELVDRLIGCQPGSLAEPLPAREQAPVPDPAA
jgi:hypothetical protein